MLSKTIELHEVRLDFMRDRAAYYLDKEQNETGPYQKCQYFKMFTMYENMIIEEKNEYSLHRETRGVRA